MTALNELNESEVKASKLRIFETAVAIRRAMNKGGLGDILK